MKPAIIILLCFVLGPGVCGFGIFSPISGAYREAGHRDGVGGGALFNDPLGLARDGVGNLYVCDARNHVIRKITPAGEVSTLAGQPGEPGAVDGTGAAARFHFPADVAVASTGDLFIADSGNHCIRRITPNGVVSTFAGQLGNADDITEDYGTEDYTVVPVQIDGRGAAARFNNPAGLTLASDGHLYVSDTGNQVIRRIDGEANVVTLAGLPGVWGKADGSGTEARFCSPRGLCLGADGNVYIADSHNHAIRCMTPNGEVTTFSGNTAEFGCRTGPRLDARYCEPTDITPHPEGGFIVCESFGNAMFRLDPGGEVSIFAGAAEVVTPPDPEDLFGPVAAVCDDQGNVYVSDTFNQQVRLIIEEFGISISGSGESRELTITWDSLPGREYQLQVRGAQGWEDAPLDPVRAEEDETSIELAIPEGQKIGLYRIMLLGF